MGYALYIGPTRDLCHKEQGIRLMPYEVVLFEEAVRKAFGREANQDFSKSDDGFHCAALKSSFFVTWNGFIQPCAMLQQPQKKLEAGLLLKTFHELGDVLTALDHCDDCATCQTRGSCIQCYARRYLEGNANTCHPYLKAIATLREKPHHG
jgi:MoaA/NifB/PqqE/SkfB family radical SAM enzyme